MMSLLEDGLSALSDLLQSGAGSCHPETEERLSQLAQAWEGAGLHTGSQLLFQVSEALSVRRHGGEENPAALMELVGRAARYIRLCQQKYALDQAERRLCQQKYEEEDHETTE